MATADLYASLLSLHSALLAATRAEYEKAHGAVPNAGAMLQLVIGDEAFAWLRPLSKLLVDLDDKEIVPDDAAARSAVERLMSPGNPFSERYLRMLPDSPTIAEQHAEVMRVMGHSS